MVFAFHLVSLLGAPLPVFKVNSDVVLPFPFVNHIANAPADVEVPNLRKAEVPNLRTAEVSNLRKAEGGSYATKTSAVRDLPDRVLPFFLLTFSFHALRFQTILPKHDTESHHQVQNNAYVRD